MKIEDIKMRKFACHQSSISCAHGCERCWFFKERWGVELRGVQVKEGASLGTVYHKFQQLGPEKQDLVLPWVRKKQVALMVQVEKGEDLDGQILRMANLYTTLYNKAHAMAQLFWERYPTPDYLKTIGTEINHTMTISDGPLAGMVLTGIIDKLIQDERNRDVWIRDHKSTGMKTLDVVFAGFIWSTQARMYRILTNSYLGSKASDVPCSGIKGFILDGILKPGIKLCGKDDKNSKAWNCSVEEAYLRRVKEWYAEKDKTAILSKSIVYNEPLFPPELIYELGMMKALGARPNKPEMYGRDPSRFHCFLYDSQCIYYDLCSSPKAAWPKLFDDKYQIKEDEKEDAEKTNKRTADESPVV